MNEGGNYGTLLSPAIHLPANTLPLSEDSQRGQPGKFLGSSPAWLK